MNGFGRTLASISMMALASVPAIAQTNVCRAVLTNGEAEFLQHDHVPAKSEAFCYTFAVSSGRHVSMDVSQVEKMQMEISVREVGADPYRPLLGGVTSFSNTDKMGRILSFASTDAEAKEFKVYISPNKVDPDASQEFTFRIQLR